MRYTIGVHKQDGCDGIFAFDRFSVPYVHEYPYDTDGIAIPVFFDRKSACAYIQYLVKYYFGGLSKHRYYIMKVDTKDFLYQISDLRSSQSFCLYKGTSYRLNLYFIDNK